MSRPWLTIGLLLLALAGLLSSKLYRDHAEILEHEQQRLVSLASTLNINIGEQLRASSRMLDALAQDLPLLRTEKNGVGRLNRRMSMLTESVIGIRSALAINADGIVIASNIPELIGHNMADGDRYKTMRASNNPITLYISAPFTTPLGIYTISLGRVMQNDKGDFDGYLLAVLSPDYFSVLMKSLIYSPDMRLSITHSDGKIIYSTDSSPNTIGMDLHSNSNSQFNQHLSSGKSGSFTINRSDITNDLRLIAYHTVFPAQQVADKALAVAISREYSSVLGGWRKTTAAIAALFFITAITACFGYFAYARRQLAYQKLITEKKRSEQEALARINQSNADLAVTNLQLQSREAELSDSQRLAKIGSWSWDKKSGSTRFSAEFGIIFGRRNIPEFSEQDDLMFDHGTWLKLRNARDSALQTGLGYNLELPALREDGSQFWINSRSEALRDADGNIIGLRGMVQDITERKQAESIARSERFIRTITDAMPGLVAYWDRDLRCRFANQPYLDWWGKSAQAMMEVTLEALMGASLFSINEPAIRAALAGEKQQFERFVTKPDGSIGHVLTNYIPDRDEHDNIIGLILIVTDIKALKMAEAELALASAVYQNTAEAIMVTDKNGTIQSVNPAFTEITGYPAQEAVGQTPRLLRSNHHEKEFHAGVWQQINGTGRWEGEIWNRRKNGEIFLGWQTISRTSDSNSESSRFVSVFHDITDSWHKNEHTKHLAFHDALTDLPNRSLLMERLERHIAMNERKPSSLAVLFLDLDRFKHVNDTLGHAIGDDLLVAVAQKLQSLIRQSDTVARLGGDEFVIMLDNPAHKDAVEQIANRVITIINEPMTFHGGQTAQVGTSIGIAMFPAGGATAATLIKNADTAMYEAKHAGRNTYRFFVPKADGNAVIEQS